SKEGKRIDPHPDRSFVVRDGNIFRTVPGDGFSEDDNALRSYRAYIHLQQGYQLTPYLQFFVRETYNLGKFGRPYGEAGSETLLGRIDQLEIGLVGRL
ncbi:MAG: hypothetical protein WA952_12835, partial [Lewinella sp.]